MKHQLWIPKNPSDPPKCECGADIRSVRGGEVEGEAMYVTLCAASMVMIGGDLRADFAQLGDGSLVAEPVMVAEDVLVPDPESPPEMIDVNGVPYVLAEVAGAEAVEAGPVPEGSWGFPLPEPDEDGVVARLPGPDAQPDLTCRWTFVRNEHYAEVWLHEAHADITVGWLHGGRAKSGMNLRASLSQLVDLAGLFRDAASRMTDQDLERAGAVAPGVAEATVEALPDFGHDESELAALMASVPSAGEVVLAEATVWAAVYSAALPSFNAHDWRRLMEDYDIRERMIEFADDAVRRWRERSNGGQR